MNFVRRGLLCSMGALLMNSSSDAREPKPASQGRTAVSEAPKSFVQPRHVLCFLGGEHALAQLSDAASIAIDRFANGFSIDHTYSQDAADERMRRSFEGC